MEFEGFPNY